MVIKNDAIDNAIIIICYNHYDRRSDIFCQEIFYRIFAELETCFYNVRGLISKPTLVRFVLKNIQKTHHVFPTLRVYFVW